MSIRPDLPLGQTVISLLPKGLEWNETLASSFVGRLILCSDQLGKSSLTGIQSCLHQFRVRPRIPSCSCQPPNFFPSKKPAMLLKCPGFCK